MGGRGLSFEREARELKRKCKESLVGFRGLKFLRCLRELRESVKIGRGGCWVMETYTATRRAIASAGYTESKDRAVRSVMLIE
jgi:hypothetical protein